MFPRLTWVRQAPRRVVGGCVDQNCIMQICRDNFIMSLPRSCRRGQSREQEGQYKKSFASFEEWRFLLSYLGRILSDVERHLPLYGRRTKTNEGDTHTYTLADRVGIHLNHAAASAL